MSNARLLSISCVLDETTVIDYNSLPRVLIWVSSCQSLGESTHAQIQRQSAEKRGTSPIRLARANSLRKRLTHPSHENEDKAVVGVSLIGAI